MDLIALGNLSNNTLVPSQGRLINGTYNLTWIERYREAGEFQITGQMSSGVLDTLTKGTLVSHMDTRELMIVENIEINEARSESPTVSISGRSAITFLENRIVGANATIANNGAIPDYVLNANAPWTQAFTLLRFHILAAYAIYADDVLPGVAIAVNADGIPLPTWNPPTARIIKRGTVYERLMEILEPVDFGVRSYRDLAGGDTTFWIHNGLDKSNLVVFSWDKGDLESTGYLTSSKKDKNTAFVTGNAVYGRVNGTETGLNRRMIFLEDRDIDENQKPPHDASTYTALQAKIAVRGNDAIKANNSIEITAVDISPKTKYEYGRDYSLGDVVLIEGNYGASSKMRIVEYVYIEDESGQKGYPTLASLYAF